MDSPAENRKYVCAAFASVLRSGRDEFNAQFAEARRAYPELDGSVFDEFLRGEVDLLIRAIEKAGPENLAAIVIAAYETGLELAGQKLIGPGARYPVIETGWRRVLSAVPDLLAAAPARVIRAVSNALYYLATTPGTRPEEWIIGVETLGPKCSDVDALLRLGQVAAWKAGLAHFRAGAIAEADKLPPELALAAVGAPDSAEWSEVRKHLLDNPWLDPAAPMPDGKGSASTLQLKARAGAFRGFGGVFGQPPLVVASGQDFLVRSGEECWLLSADFFGSTFHRATVAEFESARQGTKLPPGLRATDSQVVWNDAVCELPGLGKITSIGVNATTVAVTSEWTHSVALISLLA